MIVTSALLLVAIGCSFTGALPYSSSPYELARFGEGPPVYGIFVAKAKVYVVRDSTPHIEIYSGVREHEHLDNVTVQGMQGPYDMVGSDLFWNVFIADWFEADKITVASLKVDDFVKRFSFNEPFTVIAQSIYRQGSEERLIVACSQTQKIKEFTIKGNFIKEVPVMVTQPRQALKLQSDQGYVICHGYGPDQLHRVCKLDNNGNILNCYGGSPGSGAGQLDVPARLLEDKDGNILVLDSGNNRIVVLNSQLQFVQVLLTASNGLDHPYRIHVDKSLFYVADNTVDENGYAVSGRILIYRVK